MDIGQRAVWVAWVLIVAVVGTRGAIGQAVFRAAPVWPMSGTTADATGLGFLADVGSPSGPLDGRLDLVTFSQGQQASVLFGSPTGFVVGPSIDLLGLIPTALASGDWDRDGFVDFALGDSSNFVSFWRGRGDGTFELAGDPIDVTLSPRALLPLDLNQDNRTDIVVVGENLLQAGVGRVLYGNGDGTFTRTPELFDTGFGSVAVAAGDVTGDGHPDLAVANEATNEVYILRGDRNGAFTLARRLPVGQSPSAVVLLDLNGDGGLDLVVTNTNSDSLTVFLGQGNGSFTEGREFPVGAAAATPRGLAFGDVDGDGRLDALVANNFSFDVSVLRGNGRGGFAAPRGFVADAEPLGVLVADLDGDGLDDAVALTRGSGNSPTAALLRSLGDGKLSGVENVPLTGGPTQAAVADLDRDGLPDLAVAQGGSSGQAGRVRLLASFGAAGFGQPREQASGGDAVSIVTGDFDGDLRADVILTNRSPRSMTVLRQQPNGGFVLLPPVAHQAGSVNNAVAVDLNGDGRTDVVLVGQTSSGGVVQVFLGGALSLQPLAPIGVGDLPLAIDFGDFNRDGRPDLITANNGSANVSILLGNGDGTFQTPTTRAAVGGPRTIAVADFDRDGAQDLAVSTTQPPSVNVFFGDGTGRFPNSLPQPLSVGSGDIPSSVSARDFNGDGAPDIVVAGETNNSVRLFLRAPADTRRFQSAQVVGVNRRPVSLAVGDFDGDGRYDTAAATTSPAPTVSILSNVGGVSITRGDAGGDGRLSVADVLTTVRKLSEIHMIRIESLNDRASVLANKGIDADGDGLLTRLDLASLPGLLFR